MPAWSVSLVVMGLLAMMCRQTVQEDPGRFHESRRLSMVKNQLESRGIANPRVLEAMSRVERHDFVPEKLASQAYNDHPLPIGHGQTISQPYIVAFMTEAVSPQPTDRVLEIGTGSGYQAAILGELVKEVYTIEIVRPLGLEARSLLKRKGYRNVHVRIGDGHAGWPEAGPFDIIMLTAAPLRVPDALFSQLKPGGRLVAPVGDEQQDLVRHIKGKDGMSSRVLLPVRFVPMTGGKD